MTSAKGRPIIERQSADDRQTVGRYHFIKEPYNLCYFGIQFIGPCVQISSGFCVGFLIELHVFLKLRKYFISKIET